jgi:hypothetical protein
MANFSKKVMGKEVGSASVYAKPHTLTGSTSISLGNNGYPNDIPNTNIAKIRGTGCATKGIKNSGRSG